MGLTDGSGLSLEDHRGIARLKYVRNRTLAKAKRRDPEYLLRIVTPRYLRWDPDGPLMEHIHRVQVAIHGYGKAKSATEKDDCWAVLLASVDAVIREGERIEGHRIKPNAI